MPDGICGLRSHNLHTLWADCEQGNDFSSVFCDENCCTQCFGVGSDFIPYAGYYGDAASYAPKTAPPVTAEVAVVPGRSFPPTTTPDAAPSLMVEDPELKSFLLGHMDGFEQRLSDTSSHAYEAYMWLANDDKSLDELDPMRKLQRFGLVTFFYSTAPELSWKVSEGWKTNEHECSWFGITCGIPDTLTELSLPSNRLSGTIPPEIVLAGIGGKVSRHFVV